MTLPAKPQPAFGHVACCIDESPESLRTLEHVRDVWAPSGGRLSIVHVTPKPLMFETIDGEPAVSPADISSRQRRWLDARAAGVPGAQAVVLEGLPGPEICRWAADAGVDLLVAAAHGGGPLAVLGSVTRYLVSHAPCPVLVVRGGSTTPTEAPN